MKSTKPSVSTAATARRRPLRFAAAPARDRAIADWALAGLAAAALFVPARLPAASGTWIAPGSGSWDTSTDWTSGTIANGTAATADFSTVASTGAQVTLDGSWTVETLKFAANSTWTINPGTGSSNTLTLAGTAGINTGGVGSVITINAVLAGTAGLTKSSAGTLILTAANTLTGTVTDNNGTLILTGGDNRFTTSGAGVSLAFGSGANAGTVQLGDATGANNETVNSLTVSGTSNFTNNKVVGGNVNVSTLTVNTSANDVFTGTLGGTGANQNNLALTKIGAAQLTLDAVTSYTGGTNVNQGTLALGTNNVLAATGAISLGGGTLDLAGFNDTVGAVTLASGAIVSSGSAGTLTGSSYTVQSGTISAILAGAGSALTQTGSGTVILSAANTYGGGTTVNQGSLVLGVANALPVGGVVTIAGGTVDLAGFSDTVGAVTLTGGAIVNSGGAGAVLTGTSYNVQSGSISALLGGAASGLTKSGAGVVTLTGANTYGGATLVSSGTLNISAAQTGGGSFAVSDGASLGVTLAAAGQTLSTSALTLGGTTGATLNLNLGAFGNPTAPLISAGSFVANGTDTINVTGAGLSIGDFTLISYTGSIGGNGFGALTLGTLPARVTASLVNDATDGLVQFDVTAFDIPKWTGAVNGNWDIDDGSGTVGTLNWKLSGSGAVTGYYQGGAVGTDSVLFDDSATGTTTVNLTTVLTPINVTVNNSLLSYTFGGSGKLSGATTLTKEGTELLLLSNTGGNDYAGTTTISGGTLQVGDGLTAGAGQLGTGPVLINLAGTLSFAHPAGDDLTVPNVVSGSGTLTQSGGDTVTLSGDSASFSGAFVVASGTLKLGNAAALGTAAGDVENNAALDVTGYSFGNTLQLSGGTVKVTAGTGSAVTGSVTLNGGGSVDAAAGSVLTIAGPIGGSGGLSITDSGTVILGGTNGYAGGTSVNAGVLQLANASGLGSITDGTVVQTGAVLDVAGLAITAPLQLDGGALRSSSGTGGGVSSGVTLNGGGIVDVAANAVLTVSGPVTGAGGLNKTSTGTLILSGNNSYADGTTISAGTLQFSTPAALPATGSITLGLGAVAGFSFSFDQTLLSQFVPAATSATIALGADNANNLDFTNYPGLSLGAIGNVAYSGTLTAGGGSYQLGGGGGVLTVSSVLSGSNSLTIGSASGGTVALTAANSFSGGTVLDSGTLKLANAAALGLASNALTVDGATLDLNGVNLTVGSLTANSSGIITDNSGTPGTTILTDNPASGSSTFTGSISDGANRIIAFVKSGPGTLILNKANGNHYSGGTTLNGGVLNVRTNNAQVLPSGSSVTITGTSTFIAENDGTGAGSLSLGALDFNAGDGTVESDQGSSGTTDTLTFAGVPSRAAGATGNFTLVTATDPSKFKVVLTGTVPTGQSLNGGLFFNGADFAAYDPSGYLRALNYATDANAIAVNGGQATLGTVTGDDVEIAAGTGDITGETTDTLRSLKIAGADNLVLDSGSDATLTITGGGLLKTGGSAAAISGGGGLTTGGSADLVVRTDQAADILTISTPILASTTGGLTKTGAGVLVLTAVNSYGGATWINGGVLRADDGVGLAGGNLTINGGVFETDTNFGRGLGTGAGQVQLVGGVSGFSANGGNVTIDLSGAGAGGAYTVVWGSPAFNPSALTLNEITAANGLTFTNGLDLNGASRTINVNANIAAITGVISATGGGSLIKAGAGQLLLAAANTYVGGTTVTAGTLQLGNLLALGPAGNALTIDGSTLDLNGFNTTVGSLTANGTGIITDNSATPGTTILTASPVSGSTIFAGSISDGANRAIALVKSGAGALVLNKANGNHYSGGTTVDGGSLEIRTNNAQVLPTGSNLSFAGTGTFVAGNNGTGTGSLTLGALAFNAGNGTVESDQESTGTADTLTFSTVTRAPGATGNFTLVTATDPSAYEVVVTNAVATGQALNGGIFFNGSNFATYDPAGYVRALNYSGDANALSVNGGQPAFGNSAVNDVQIAAGTGDITDQTSTIINSLKIAGADNLVLDSPSSAILTISSGGLLKAGGGASTISGGAGITTGGAGDLVVRTDQATDILTLATPILATTTGGLTKAGNGVLTLGVANSFTGTTTINGGTVALGDPLALQNSTLNYNGTGGSISFGSLSAATFGGLEGEQALGLTNSASGNVALTVGGNNASTVYSGILSGGGSLTKIGAGNLALSGANTETGPTTINGGALVVSGSINGSVTTVNSGGTLAGTGVAGVVLVNSGGTLAPGDLSGAPAAPLTLSSLALNDGSTLSLNIGTGTSDAVDVTGTVAFAGNINLELNLSTPSTDGFDYIILSGAALSGLGSGASLVYAGAPVNNGSILEVTGPGLAPQAFQISYGSGDEIALLAVPEPSAMVSILGGTGLLLGLRRRRR